MLTSSSSGTLIRRVGHEKAFRMFHEAGLEAMDFPVDDGVRDEEALKGCKVYGLSEEQIFAKFGEYGRYARENGVEIFQTHSMFGYMGAPEPSYMDAYTDITIKDIAATKAIGGKVTVVHPIRIKGQMLDMFDEGFALNMDFYSRLRPACEKYGVRVAIENTMTVETVDGNRKIRATQSSDPRELVRLVRELGSDCFCTCADTGHFALTAEDSGFSVGDSIRVLGDTLGVVHIQEVDGLDDRHQVPFTYAGPMDWDDIFKALAEVGFRGPANLEVMPHLAKYPDCDEMNAEALRHIGAISRYVAKRIEAAR